MRPGTYTTPVPGGTPHDDGSNAEGPYRRPAAGSCMPAYLDSPRYVGTVKRPGKNVRLTYTYRFVFVFLLLCVQPVPEFISVYTPMFAYGH